MFCKKAYEEGCSLCMQWRCCPEHCCDWEDCSCGDCQLCGGGGAPDGPPSPRCPQACMDHLKCHPRLQPIEVTEDSRSTVSQDHSNHVDKLPSTSSPPSLPSQSLAPSLEDGRVQHARVPSESVPQYLSPLASLDQQIAAMDALYKEMQDAMRQSFTELYGDNAGKLETSAGRVNSQASGELLEFNGAEIVMDPQLGRVLVATQVFEAGDIILQERPAVIVPPSCIGFGQKSNYMQLWSSLDAGLRLELRSNFEAHLDLVSESDRKHLLLSREEVQAEVGDLEPDDLLRLYQIIKVNSKQWGSSNALFKVASKLCHSCVPSCALIQVYDDLNDCPESLVVRAIRRIHHGEFLSISYLPMDADIFCDTSWRQRILMKSKFFICQCSRCDSADLARALPATDICTCRSEDALLIPKKSVSATASSKAASLNSWVCSACGTDHSAESMPLAQLLAKERWLLEQMMHLDSELVEDNTLESDTPGFSETPADHCRQNVLEDSSQTQKVSSQLHSLLYKALDTCGPQHWIAPKLASLYWDTLFASQISADESNEALKAVEIFAAFVTTSCPNLKWHSGCVMVSAFIKLLRWTGMLMESELHAALSAWVEDSSGGDRRLAGGQAVAELAPKAWVLVQEAVKRRREALGRFQQQREEARTIANIQ